MKKTNIFVIIGIVTFVLILLLLNMFTDIFVQGPMLVDYVDYPFDSNIYYQIFDSVSPIIDKETDKPVLDKENCNRYAYWLTEQQKDTVDFAENNSSYPAWGDKISSLVDYCLENGDYVKNHNGKNLVWIFRHK